MDTSADFLDDPRPRRSLLHKYSVVGD